jgi:hypothetical protein
MSLSARLDALEQLFTPRPACAPPGFTFEAEAERWLTVLAPALDGLPDEAAENAVLETITQEFGWLKGLVLTGLNYVPEALPRKVAEHRRWPNALALALAKSPAALRPRVVASLGVRLQDGDPELCQLHSWAWGIHVLHHRLPPDVAEETVGLVLGAVIAGAHRKGHASQTCDDCGLCRPCGHEELFGGRCPHCRCEGWTYTHLVQDQPPRPWSRLAEAELDPEKPDNQRS